MCGLGLSEYEASFGVVQRGAYLQWCPVQIHILPRFSATGPRVLTARRADAWGIGTWRTSR
jgi:hypothetical protein